MQKGKDTDMKGKNEFSKGTAHKIRTELSRLRDADKPTQKSIRSKLRKDADFYIQDFSSSKKGFSVSDFDGLVRIKKITIV